MFDTIKNLKKKIHNIDNIDNISLRPDWLSNTNSIYNKKINNNTSTNTFTNTILDSTLFENPHTYLYYNEIVNIRKQSAEFIKPQHQINYYIYVNGQYNVKEIPKPKSKFVSHFTSQFITELPPLELNNEDYSYDDGDGGDGNDDNDSNQYRNSRDNNNNNIHNVIQTNSYISQQNDSEGFEVCSRHKPRHNKH